MEIGRAQALAKLLAVVDCDRGIRIDPPKPNQIYYKAFLPETDLLERAPSDTASWKLSLANSDGRTQGMLQLIQAKHADDGSIAKLQGVGFPISSPIQFRRKLEAESARLRKFKSTINISPAILVEVPATFHYGILMDYLRPHLPQHKIFQVIPHEGIPPRADHLP